MLSGRSFRLLFVLFVILVGVGGGVMRSPYFNIASVRVYGAEQVSQEEVMALTGVDPGQNIFDLRIADVQKAALGHPWIKSISLARRLPDQVELTIAERCPFFLVPYRTSFLEVAEDGVVLAVRPILSGQALPLVTGFSVEEQVRLGQRLAAEEVALVGQCLKGLPADFWSQVAEIHLDENGEITLYSLDKVQILLGEPIQLNQKLALLSGTWAELEDQQQKAIRIDVRSGKEAIVRPK
ncbi:MAG TPA: FtsQ-type POTRA domain-containing protein [bacterium]|jgi:cell division protein FtsQ|nr:FtsQ-type POTRA domain-containing protein [bacterium]